MCRTRVINAQLMRLRPLLFASCDGIDSDVVLAEKMCDVIDVSKKRGCLLEVSRGKSLVKKLYWDFPF